MARALTLCKNGAITIDAIRVSKESGKPVVFTKAINRASGKESTKDTAFSFAGWGLRTMDYLSMIREDLREKSRQKIRTQAYEYYKINRSQSALTTASALSMDLDEPERPRRRIVDLSDSEE
jgi:exopolyphosphatase/pppGpp-phosphohydrolase